MSGVPLPVGPLYGAVYFGAILSAAFYGVTCMQTFLYYIHYQQDPLRTKSVVASVWALNTIHEALIISGAYKYIVASLVNPQSYLTVPLEFDWEVLLTILVSIITQVFFVYRIYRISGKRIIGPLVWLPLGVFQMVSALLYLGKSARITSLVTLGETFFMDIALSWCAVAAGVDITIAMCLTYLLARRRIAAGFNGTAKALQFLTVFAINSGIWTAIFALLTVVLLGAIPTGLDCVVFDFPLCSVYCNTLLANINARAYAKSPSSTDLGTDLITDRKYDSQ